MNNEQPKPHAPTEGTYLAVFLALAGLTLVELAVTYIPIVKVPLLLGLSAGKAWLVIQFYMHLRYENRTLTWSFLLPVFIAIGITLAIQPLMH